MRSLLVPVILLLAAACGGPADTLSKAKVRAAQLVQAPNRPGQVSVKNGDASGCQDRAEAGRLVAASKKEDQSEYIKLWGDGMKDYRCRAFAEGLGATVKETGSDGWACIIPADDADNKKCFWIEPGKLG